MDLPDNEMKKAADTFQRMADEDGISTTISSSDGDLIEFKPKGRVQ